MAQARRAPCGRPGDDRGAPGRPAAAASEGVPPTELVGHHPRGFALTWAVGLAATQGFSTDRAVVAGDLLVPAFTLAASVVAVRLQAVRRTSEAARSRPAVLGETVA